MNRPHMDLEAGFDITMDYDDIFWPFVGRVAQRLGIDLASWTEFYAPMNQHWPAGLLERANELLADPEIYRDIVFDPGIKDILRPQELGARILINSNSPSKEIIELKKEQLMAAVPGLKPENLRFNLIKLNTVSEKTLSPQTLIFVDDNPYHVLASTAPITIMRQWPWNMSASAKRLLAKKQRVVRLDSLDKINKFIYHRAKILLRSGI